MSPSCAAERACQIKHSHVDRRENEHNVSEPTTLIVTLDAYRYSTRSRKAAITYRASGRRVVFVGLAGAGRTGRWDRAGRFTQDGLEVWQVQHRTPWLLPTSVNVCRNAILVYFPAFLRLASAVLKTRADTVHVVGSALAVLGVLHRFRYRSNFVLDLHERPGAVASRGSVAALFSPIELSLLRLVRRFVTVVTVVTTADVHALSRLGYQQVLLIRNAPLRDWRASYRPPHTAESRGVVAVVIGSIFEGRGYEILLKALAHVPQTSSVVVRVFGMGRPDYLARLRALSEELQVDHIVEWRGPLDSSAVSSAYLDGDIGLVLYEPSDAGNDGLSNKILECVSTGRPVIAGDLPENRKFVSENHVGWLTEVSATSLARTLIEVTQDAAAIYSLSQHCRAIGDNWLNWEAEFAALLDCIQTLPEHR